MAKPIFHLRDLTSEQVPCDDNVIHRYRVLNTKLSNWLCRGTLCRLRDCDWRCAGATPAHFRVPGERRLGQVGLMRWLAYRFSRIFENCARRRMGYIIDTWQAKE